MEAATVSEQRMVNLGRANEVRAARAKVKRKLGEGRSPVPVILRPGPYFRGMTVGELLLSCYGLGPAMVRRVLHDARIRELELLGELEAQDRGRLILRLRQTPAASRW